MVHRLVAEAFVPNPSNKLQVNHIDGDKSHNYWLNLEWVSNQENMAHAFKTGLNKNEFGENSRRAILTQSQVNAIRHAVNNGASQTYLASMYGVSRSTINKIARGISWKSMEKDDDK
jgi:DNA-binding XRE family transcriptional regulator